jgi:hypothetical protein
LRYQAVELRLSEALADGPGRHVLGERLVIQWCGVKGPAVVVQ